MRIFLAVEFSDEQKQQIREVVGVLESTGVPVQWMDPERYHLTLKFFGNLAESEVSVLSSAIARIAGATRSFPLVLKGIGAFPSIRLPQVIWMAVDPTPALRCLKQDLEWGLAALGFRREVEAYQPHITLGRADDREGAGAFRGLDTAAVELSTVLKFPVTQLSLIHSQRTRDGRVYRTIGTAPLRTKVRRRSS
jgi:RNA 2',3'-cyclic 3'-phosphodiesterase